MQEAAAVVCFSTGALAIVGGLLTVLAGAIGTLFKALQSSKDAQMSILMDENRFLRDIAFKSAAAVEHISSPSSHQRHQ